MLSHLANWVLCFDFVKTHAKHDPICHDEIVCTMLASERFCYASHSCYVYILYKFGCYAEHNTKFMQEASFVRPTNQKVYKSIDKKKQISIIIFKFKAWLMTRLNLIVC